MAPPFFRDPTTGYWGYPSSTMDWCEDNYYVTYYVAEFWNSFSNLIFLIPPLLVMYHAYRAIESRYLLALSSLALIGFGSFAFHSTLLYHSQLLDELPMVYGTCSMLYCIIKINSKENSIDTRAATILSLVSIAVTVVYIYGKNPLIFLWSYGLLAALLFILNVHGCIRYGGSKRMLLYGSLSYAFGFILWNIDNEFCYSVRAARNSLPWLLKPILQLHAWWHFFAGIGTYLTIQFSIRLRLLCQGSEPMLHYVGKIIPYYISYLYLRKVTNDETELVDINGNATPVRLKSRSKNGGSAGNFSRLL